MASETERARHALEKGKLLEILRESYGGAPVMVTAIAIVMDRLGFPMSPDGLQFALNYLADAMYVQITRAQDVPGFRRDRMPGEQTPHTIVMARLLPLGLRLIDGNAIEDPQVRF